jgi:histone demethylase JARID1
MCEHLQELGSADAFSCSELDMLLSKVEKVEKWMKRCIDVLGTSIGDKNSLLDALRKVSICLSYPFSSTILMLYSKYRFDIFKMYFIAQIKQTLDRSLYMYDKSRVCEVGNLCVCCSSDTENLGFLTCSTCMDW